MEVTINSHNGITFSNLGVVLTESRQWFGLALSFQKANLQVPKSSEKYSLLMQPIILLGIEIAGGRCELLPD